MAVEAYIPHRIEFNGAVVGGPTLVTLYNPDSDHRRGSLTAAEPIATGARGRLTFEGTRGGKVWSVTCPEIEVDNKSALGCEFEMRSPPERVVLRELDDKKGPRKKGMEEQFDIR